MFLGFWKDLPRPIVGLSPMDGVTDAAMRKIVSKYGDPSVIFTEFVSAEGIKAGAVKLLSELIYSEEERPVVAQLFGTDTEAFYISTMVVCALGFDGVDINMGCPSKSVAGRGGGAGLIKKPELAREIVEVVKKGIEDWVGDVELKDIGLSEEMVKEVEKMKKEKGLKKRVEIPVSVKTRIGYESKEEVEEWMKTVVGFGVAAVSLHGRTFRQMYRGEADWEVIGEMSKFFKDKETLFLGNGDVKMREDVDEKVKKYGVDGVLIGRAAMGNPFVFKEGNEKLEYKKRLKIAIEHARVYEEIFGKDWFLPMRKHLAWYAKGFEGVSELRSKLVRTKSADEVEKLIKEYL